MEMEIDVLRLIREYRMNWRWLALAIGIGVASGLGLAGVLKKKYSAQVLFLSHSSESGAQPFANLGLLTGKLGVAGSGEESPYIEHFKDIVRTRTFKLEVRSILYGDSAYYPAWKLFGQGAAGSGERFASDMGRFLRTRIKEGVYEIQAVTPDPEASMALSKAVFRTYDSLIRRERQRAILENYHFIEGFVAKNKQELEEASTSLRIFLEQNREVGSPKLEQERQRYVMRTKLAEEKYLVSVKELEALKMKKEKNDRNLILIEDAFIDKSPIFPQRTKFVAAGAFSAILLALIILAFTRREAWIRIPSPAP